MSLRAGLLSVALLCGCNTAPAPAEPAAASGVASAPTPQAPEAQPAGRVAFGAPLTPGPVTALTDVLKAPDKFADQSVLVEGRVRRACTRKGCWMELSEAADPAAPGCRVTFKDYGFFVPTDSAGSSARVQAKVESKVVKASMVEHLESEGAKFADKSPDGSAREVRLVATGVELWR